MSGRRIVGLVLIVLGIVALVWGGVFWTDRDTVVDAGPLEVQTEETEGFALPPVAVLETKRNLADLFERVAGRPDKGEGSFIDKLVRDIESLPGPGRKTFTLLSVLGVVSLIGGIILLVVPERRRI